MTLTIDELTEAIEHDDIPCHGDVAKMAREILTLRARVAELEARRQAENAGAEQQAIDLGEEVSRRVRAESERDEARALAEEMWRRADDWSGARASSHYRSDIDKRLRWHRGCEK